ncbi:hypothetical protein ABK040_007040 [Willaertia magna]
MAKERQANETFLFSTNNISGMRLNRNEIDGTKWNTLNFPENCKFIKKIVCGAEFVVICNEQNELYFFGNFESNKTNLWNKLNIKINNLKNIFANYSNLIIQLNNDDIAVYRKETQEIIRRFNKCGIKFISTGPLSSSFMVTDNNNKVYQILHTTVNDVDTSENDKNSDIKFIACTSTAFLLVTSENKIYGSGSSTFGELGNLNISHYKFQYMSTPFEKESEIIDVKGGYYHFVVLLKSGIVYAIGYNCVGAVNVYNQSNVTQFTQLTHPLFENEIISGINCSSRGTVLITKSNNAYFIGEVVYTLTGYEHNNNERIIDTDNKIESYKVNGNTIQKVKLCDKYNDVLAGGWHYIIYYNYGLNNKSKSLQHFEKKLLNLIKEPHCSDISVVTLC